MRDRQGLEPCRRVVRLGGVCGGHFNSTYYCRNVLQGADTVRLLSHLSLPSTALPPFSTPLTAHRSRFLLSFPEPFSLLYSHPSAIPHSLFTCYLEPFSLPFPPLSSASSPPFCNHHHPQLTYFFYNTPFFHNHLRPRLPLSSTTFRPATPFSFLHTLPSHPHHPLPLHPPLFHNPPPPTSTPFYSPHL